MRSASSEADRGAQCGQLARTDSEARVLPDHHPQRKRRRVLDGADQGQRRGQTANPDIPHHLEAIRAPFVRGPRVVNGLDDDFEEQQSVIIGKWVGSEGSWGSWVRQVLVRRVRWFSGGSATPPWFGSAVGSRDGRGGANREPANPSNPEPANLRTVEPAPDDPPNEHLTNLPNPPNLSNPSNAQVCMSLHRLAVLRLLNCPGNGAEKCPYVTSGDA